MTPRQQQVQRSPHAPAWGRSAPRPVGRSRTLAELTAHCEALAAALGLDTSSNSTAVDRTTPTIHTYITTTTQALARFLLPSNGNGGAAAKELSARAACAAAEVRAWAGRGRAELSASLRVDPALPLHAAGDVVETAHNLAAAARAVDAAAAAQAQLTVLVARYAVGAGPLVDAALEAKAGMDTTQAVTTAAFLEELRSLRRAVEGACGEAAQSAATVAKNRAALQGRLAAQAARPVPPSS